MGKLQELLDRLRRSAEPEPEEEQEQEQTPEEGSDTPTEEVTSEPEESGEMEQVTMALELVGGQLETIIRAVQLIDKTVKDHDVLLQGFAKSESERLKMAVQGGEWYKSLFVTTRDANPATEGEDLSLVQQAPVQEGVGLLDPIIHGNQ